MDGHQVEVHMVVLSNGSRASLVGVLRDADRCLGLGELLQHAVLGSLVDPVPAPLQASVVVSQDTVGGGSISGVHVVDVNQALVLRLVNPQVQVVPFLVLSAMVGVNDPDVVPPARDDCCMDRRQAEIGCHHNAACTQEQRSLHLIENHSTAESQTRIANHNSEKLKTLLFLAGDRQWLLPLPGSG